MNSSLATRTSDAPTCDDRPLWDLMMSIYSFPTLTVADELGVFGYLETNPTTAEEVANHFALSARSTEALLGVLTSLGLLLQRDGRFSITDLTRHYLLPRSPYYWGGLLRLMRDTPATHTYLLDAIRNDKPSDDIWERQAQDPQQAEVFNAGMESMSSAAALGVARHGNFEGVTRLLDVGGGSGCFSIALAQRYPEISFTILELPATARLSERYVAASGLTNKIDTVALDMFHDPWPAGHDAVFFSNIFRAWGCQRCEHLVAQSYSLLPTGGRIYIHEVLLDDTKYSPLIAALGSMEMIVWTEGKQFSARELAVLLSNAGFCDTTVVHTFGYYSLVSGRKP